MRQRSTPTQRGFEAHAISGTHTILIALNCPEECRTGLMGFAFERTVLSPHGGAPKFLRSMKVFESVVPHPEDEHDPADPSKPKAFYTDQYPIQSFLWGDYSAYAGVTYAFRILPMYGTPGALTTDPRDEIAFQITTEKEWEDGYTHGIWFNRGAIASQKFAEEFGNKPPENINDPEDKEVIWLSRGLLEACLRYINETKPGDALRVAAYEFTYPPVLDALKDLIDRQIDVQIAYHDTTDPATGEDGANEKAMRDAGLPINDQRITFRRSKTEIPHNKFIVRLQGGTTPVEVWTGSTNFTASGFLGQTNVGHRVADADTAATYHEFWKLITTDPELPDARAALATLTPDPPEVIPEDSIHRLFSPRSRSAMLGWYGRRMLDAASSVWFTAAFGVTKDLVGPISQKRPQMRFVLMEKPAPEAQKQTLTADFNRVILSYGTPLGQLYQMKNGKVTTRKPIQGFGLDKWFFKEDHFRHEGFVFFVHTKFLLIDPLSADPLVCTGSANFSPNSLLANDENMLLIRGSTRVADIYMTEFDRVFRHFYFRDIANELTGANPEDDKKSKFLYESDEWTKSYFKAGTQKSNRRLMFFAAPATNWAAQAAAGTPPAPAPKPTAKKAPAKKAPAKKALAKKASAKKAPTKNAAKKASAKKAPTKNAAKKAPAKKSAKKAPPQKTVKKVVPEAAKKAAKKAPAKKVAVKKAPAKKAAKKAASKTVKKPNAKKAAKRK